jgi:hypothetical protein
MNYVILMQMNFRTFRRSLRVWCCAAVLPFAGCYVYRPVVAPLAPGTRIALELNDRGRAGVADSLGPELTHVEGELVSRTDSLYVLRVSRVRDIRGDRTRWRGEPASVRQEFVKDVAIRELSKQRTAMLVGGIAIAAVTFVVTRDLLGFGGSDDDGGNGEPSEFDVTRWPPIPTPP